MKDYTKGACPVIELSDLSRAILRLPSRKTVNDETKSDTYVVTFDGNEEKFVMFDWDEKGNGWRLRNKIVLDVNQGIHLYYCSTCNTKEDHLINNALIKKKCKKCNQVTDI